MLKKTISYTDFNGTPVTNDFYFNLNEAELVEIEAEFENGIQSVIETQNKKDVIKFVKLLLTRSVGIKSEDGKRFVKPEGMAEDFYSSGAYPKLFVEVCKSEQAMTDFLKGVVPAEVFQKSLETTVIS